MTLALTVFVADGPLSKGTEALGATLRSLEGRATDIVVTEGEDRGAARTAALGRAKHGVVLALDAGEVVDPGAWGALAAFVAGDAALGVVSVLRQGDDGLVCRARSTRLLRTASPGARFEGATIDRAVASGAALATEIVVHAPARDAAELSLALRDELATKPSDTWVATRLAEALASSEPLAAFELASAVLDALDADDRETPAVVLALATALHVGGGAAELLGLASACRDRFPTWAELRLFEALAHGARGDDRAMIASLEECLRLGEDAALPGTVGAGTTVPFFHLATLAEKAGDRRAARSLFARALPLPPAKAALERLADDAAQRAPVPRLVSNDLVATKPCRHGTFTYPVNDAFVGRALDLYGEWCEDEIDVLAPLLREGDVVVDVGANVGTHAIALARCVGPAGRVVAFEPQGFAYGLLASNALVNGLAQIECRRAAVGASVGEVAIPVVDPRAKANFGAVAVARSDSHGEAERVPMTSLDALGLERCALVKIDVEGLEADVLAGARDTIARCRPVLFVENDTVARSHEVIAAVHALGYRAYWQIAPYFRDDNFFGNTEDVFSFYQPQANLVCVPEGRELQGLLEVDGEDDDFVKALARAATRTVPSRTKKAARAVVAPAASPARPLTVVVCIPGREFSGRFFDAWHAFSERCREVGVRLVLSRAYDAVVYYARNKSAGGDVRRGPKQAPFGGAVDYDYMLWIDSDVVFRFEDFQRLLAHKVDLVAGLYLMADNTHYAAVEHMDEERFQRDGRFEFLTPKKLATRQGLVPVDYCGFGFVLVRRGVFEKLEYPWFRPIYLEMGACREFTSEDVGFCMLARKAGIPILVDPRVVVGHEKPVVLAPPSSEAA